MNRREKRRREKLARSGGGIRPGLDPATALQTAGELFQAGRPDQAADILENIRRADPGHFDATMGLAVIRAMRGDLDAAIPLFETATAIRPGDAEAHFNLGRALENRGRVADAAESYRRARDLDPGDAGTCVNLGNALGKLDRWQDAIESYTKAIALRPDFAEAHCNRANALRGLGRVDDAVAGYEKAIALRPDFAEAHGNLGNALRDVGRLDDAVAHYEKAIAIDPAHVEARINLGRLLAEMGRVDGAMAAFDRALGQQPGDAAWRIERALLLPVIPRSADDMDAHWRRVAAAVAAIRADGAVAVADPVNDIGLPNFNIAYHDRGNRDLLADIAGMYLAACPSLAYEAAHCRPGGGEVGTPLRVGFVSSNLSRHTVGKLTGGIIERLSRERFEVMLFHAPGRRDELSERLDRAASRVVPLQRDLEKDRSAIEATRPDILFYPDIGMDFYTYFLGFSRLAPVQVVSWGHPETTGLPAMDYFLSWDLAEPAGAAAHYTERLVRLPHMISYYYRPEAPARAYYGRDEFGLPAGARLYLCPQTLFKFHPSFDDVLGEILRRDPEGRLVLIDDEMGGAWRGLLVERFERAFPDVADRVVFVPRMPTEKFMGLLDVADAMLDLPTFSGGNSSLEAFALGVPIVTWPGRFLRGRVTAACYRQMGIEDLIATDADAYVGLALRLAHDPDFRCRMADAVRAGADRLFERDESVRQFETFFEAAYAAWRTGEALSHPWVSGSAPSVPAAD